MHVGGVRTALYSWLYARKHGGQFILRLEDTDKGREVEGSVSHIMECLKWLGIEWDESIDIGGPYAPYLQSERLDSYRAYAKKLMDAGFAYPDPYTEEEVEVFRQKAEAEKRPFLYRDHRPATILEWDGTRPLRFRTPFIKRYEWEDAIRGPLSAGEEALDDFILIKGDGYPTYNFAHVVDDIEMKITHVMRGEEFISSTPKFLSLYDALDQKPPVFATMPVILAADGKKKLGKRDGAKDLLEYRTEGYLPEAMVNFLALLGWNPGTEQEIFTVPELVEMFDLSRVQRSGARFDEEKLLFVNREHMRMLSDEAFMERGAFSVSDPERLRKALPLLKERSHTFSEARDMLGGELSCLFTAPTLKPAMLVAKEPTGRNGLTKEALENALALIQELPEGISAEEIKTRLMPFADSQEAAGKGGRGGVLWPLRYALSGSERSPDPFTLIYILGARESTARISAALQTLSDILG